jgi:hypothetical protein
MRRLLRIGCRSRGRSALFPATLFPAALSLAAPSLAAPSLAALFVAALFLPSCKSPEAKACLEQFGSAQSIVMKVEAEDLTSVVGSVAAVEEALGTCKAAGRDGEAEELGKAHAQLAAHRDRLQRRAEMLAERTELSPEELETLVKSGDPKCPRGQAYQHRKSGKHIKCIGPQPVDMSRSRAEEYFKARRYKLSPGASAAELRLEYGAELVVFAYADPNQAPRCITLYPPPDQSWQEATARLTGVAPARLKPNQPIRRPTGALPFALEESAEKVIARIGDCSS